MSSVGQREIKTQQRVIRFCEDTLGYQYLGNWQDQPDNSNVEEGLLADWLKRQGHSDKIITKVRNKLHKAAGLGGSKTLYDANREVYSLLRYGVKARPDVGEQNITVWLICSLIHKSVRVTRSATRTSRPTSRTSRKTCRRVSAPRATSSCL